VRLLVGLNWFQTGCDEELSVFVTAKNTLQDWKCVLLGLYVHLLWIQTDSCKAVESEIIFPFVC